MSPPNIVRNLRKHGNRNRREVLTADQVRSAFENVNCSDGDSAVESQNSQNRRT